MATIGAVAVAAATTAYDVTAWVWHTTPSRPRGYASRLVQSYSGHWRLWLQGNRPPRIAQLKLKRTCPAHMTGLL